MPNTEAQDAAILEAAERLWDIEDKTAELISSMALFNNSIVASQAILELSASKCARIDRRFARADHAFKMAEGCLQDLHEDADRMVGDESLVSPLRAGGGGKPDPDGGG
ncbi:MAG: hypothetical protein JKY81_01515 [Colwellia sp.]|nr:hypothetical protein [Colwellia sp.]